MATLKYQIPGVGGSLGECVVCGESFIEEIVLNKPADGIRIDGIDATLPVHPKCGELVLALNGPWREVRETFPQGPLYRCFEEEYAARNEPRFTNGDSLEEQ